MLDHWKRLRAESGKCQFLSWNNNLKPDGRFTITFFRDAQQTQPIQTENGWCGGGPDRRLPGGL
ncbi:putative lipoprotein [Pseudomonas sp. Ag1]|uniref:hypothetical protein n=1 Tax=Pseudomonas sp. Ag1 TaxID=1197727 RepID=UPI000272C233|nr:putative lipoprotein [Pseudomonas sp. Ag1]